MCGASVGLWKFTTIACPFPLLVLRMACMAKLTIKYIETIMIGASSKKNGKKDVGQRSRGKYYVEEDKRLLRVQGVYSRFDT